jgi:GAF domain-containing protein/sugar diacid utilization regulator
VPAAQVPVSLRSWMSAVSEITCAVNAAEPLDALLGRVAQQARALIGFEYCAVLLADPTGERLQVAGSSGLSADYVSLVSDAGSLLVHPPGPEEDTPAARAFREHRTVDVPDVTAAPLYGRLRPLADRQGYRALLAVPLRTPSEQSGVLVGYSVAAREFHRAERELIQLLADQTALALENARLRAAQQTVIGELSRANEELRRRRGLLEWSEQQHRALMELALADVGLVGLVTALADILRASVTVEDDEGRTLARAPETDYRPPPSPAARRRLPTRSALEAQAHSYEVVRVPEGTGRPGAAAVGHPPTVEPGAWVAPVVLGGALAGRLWVVDPRVSPAPVERRVIERFTLVVAMELLKRRQLAEAEARLAGDLLGRLLRSDGGRDTDVAERAAALGHDLARPHVLAVMTADPPLSVVRWRELLRAVTEPAGRVLAGPYEEVQVLVVPAEPDPTGLLRRVWEQRQQAAGGRAAVTLVAGPVAAEPGEYAEAYRIATGAARLRRTPRTGGFVDVRDLGLPGLLLESGIPETLRTFADRLLEPVVAHDARRGGDLVVTLRAWLAAGCSTADTAAALVVHPHTVTYRLARLEQLVGRSLRLPQTRMELQLALAVRDVAG